MQPLNNEFVFSTQPRYRLARHGLFWLVCTLSFTCTYAFIPASYLIEHGVAWPKAIGKGLQIAGLDAVLFLPTHMLLAYGIIYGLFPLFLEKGRYGWMLLGLIVLVILAAFISAVIAVFIINPVRSYLMIGRPSEVDSFVVAMMGGVRGATTVGGFVAAIKLVKIWYLKQQAYQQIIQEKLQAELQLLKSQVHPHFLFNTLNNLYALTLRKSDYSSAVVLKLSELLSYMLYDCNTADVPLQKEIEFMKNYIGLEQLRYGSRLDMSVHIAVPNQHMSIAPLLLVPFLENAFKHGASEQLEQAWIHIDLTVQGNQLRFKVINSQESIPHDPLYVGGIGLQNVKKRLQLLYANRHELRIIPENETFMVSLTLELPPVPAPVLRATGSLSEVA